MRGTMLNGWPALVCVAVMVAANPPANVGRMMNNTNFPSNNIPGELTATLLLHNIYIITQWCLNQLGHGHAACTAQLALRIDACVMA